MLTKIYQVIKEYNNIVIYRHSRPDGDALGSQLALKESLKLTYPSKNIYAVGDMNDRFSWLGEMDEVSDEIIKDSLAIILDSGADYLISDERWKESLFVIKIDHHTAQGKYGNLAYVNTNADSCSQIIAKLIFEKRYKINEHIAMLLYAGMVTDSGRFRFINPESNALDIANKLIKYGFNIDEIYNHIYMDKLANVKLRAKMIDKFIVLDSGVAYLFNSKEDIKELGISIDDVTRGMINIMSGIEEVKAWANFAENENGEVYCELRGNGINVHKIASKYGGGGHIQASGMTIPSKDLINNILDDLSKEVMENK